MQANGLRHSKSAPYHPATNGAAERVVQTLKNALRAGKDVQSVNQRLLQFLLSYRTMHSPFHYTGVSPAELFLKRSLWTRLDVMLPSLGDTVIAKQQEQK
jgi:transposase InsO family protein